MSEQSNAPQFKVKKHITLPHLKTQKGVPYYVKFRSGPFRGERNEETPREGKEPSKNARKEPPMLAQVIDLTTGQLVQIILGTVMFKELTKEFGPGGEPASSPWIGRCIMFTMHAAGEGKDYNLYDVAEIEDPATGAETDAERAKAERSMKAGRR